MTDAARESTAMTADELVALPDDDKRYELVAGALRVSEPVGWTHGDVQGALFVRLWQFARAHAIGAVVAEVGFILRRDPDTVRAPDAAFVQRARVPALPLARGYFVGAPDLAVEVLSPDDRAWEIGEKVEDYLSAGARLVWVVDPRTRRVEVSTPDGVTRVRRVGDTLEGGDVLPGFRLPLAELFAPPPNASAPVA